MMPGKLFDRTLAWCRFNVVGFLERLMEQRQGLVHEGKLILCQAGKPGQLMKLFNKPPIKIWLKW